MQQAIIDQTTYHPPCNPQKQTRESLQNSITQADGGLANPQTGTAKQQSEQPEQRTTVLRKSNTFVVHWDD